MRSDEDVEKGIESRIRLTFPLTELKGISSSQPQLSNERPSADPSPTSRSLHKEPSSTKQPLPMEGDRRPPSHPSEIHDPVEKGESQPVEEGASSKDGSSGRRARSVEKEVLEDLDENVRR